MLGVATSGATLFRSIGGSLGTAVLGAIFTGRLTAELPSRRRRRRGGLDPARSSRCRRGPRRLHLRVHRRAALVFLVATVRRARSRSLLTWLIPERPLRKTVETGGVGEALGGAGRHRLAARDHARAEPRRRPRAHAGVHGATTVERAGVDLSPGASWAAAARSARPTRPPARRARARCRTSTPERLRRRGRGAARRAGCSTASGRHAGRARDARRGSSPPAPTACATLVADWEPDENPELDPLLRRLAEELAVPR